MNTNLATLFDDLMALCEASESFYFVDQTDNYDIEYRVFTYRLASYTEFQQMNAIECRGHTFRKESDGWVLASLPMAKFFNYGEHVGWNTPMDLNSMSLIMDKLDGSLISTVKGRGGTHMFLKSKTSFSSTQATEAAALLNTEKYYDFTLTLRVLVGLGYTVNMEYMSPSNQIVIGYSEPTLTVLNVRNNATGEVLTHTLTVEYFGEEFVVKSHPIPEDGLAFLADAEKMTGIEGFVIQLADGLVFKHKTEAYCILHHLKDSINNPKRLWEACVSETADDLRALFRDDPISIEKIAAMEALASKNYNHLHKVVNAFYNENKDLDRKSYAIKGQAELLADGVFSLAMNLYIGRDANVKEFMIKNYKRFGVSDEVTGALGD
jgi:T4 RnlA family RNA ligase